MKSDIEIAQAAKLEKIGEIAAKLDIPEDSLEPFGHYKAKISLDYLNSIESVSYTHLRAHETPEQLVLRRMG